MSHPRRVRSTVRVCGFFFLVSFTTRYEGRVALVLKK